MAADTSKNIESKAVVGQDSTPGSSRRLKSKGLKIIALLIGLVFIVLIGLFVYNKVANRSTAITIGSTTVTPKEVDDLTNEMTQYAKRDKNIHYNPSPHKVARDYLVLNAALKDQAAQHHVKVTQQDINAQLAQNYKSYGGQRQYEQFLQAEGITTLGRIQSENTTYETKLENVVLAKKNLFVAGIIYDTPYVNSSNSPTPTQLRQQALQTVQNKFLPLFKEGKGTAYIASQANISPGRPAVNSTNTSTGTYFNSMPSVAFYPKGCTTAKPCFHDIKPKTPISGLPAAVSTQSVVDKLNTVGQNSGVINSEAGFVGIIELTGKTGGSYSSWDQLLKAYEKKYADGKLADATPILPLSSHIGGIMSVAATPIRLAERFPGFIGSVLLPKVSAASAGACTAASGHSDGSDHDIQININASDQNGNNLQGVNVVESRPHAQCANQNGQFIGDDDGTRNNGNTDSSGNLTFYDNCYNSAPDFVQTAPSGYHLTSVFVQDGMGDNSTMTVGTTFKGTPVTEDNAIDRAVSDSGIWTNGILNIAGQLTINLHYNKPAPQLPNGSINAQCQNNITVSGVNDGYGNNAHFYVVLTASGGSTPNAFPSNNSPSGGTYFGGSQTIPVPNWVKNRTGTADVGVQLWVQSTTGNYVQVNSDTIIEPCAQPTCHPGDPSCPTCTPGSPGCPDGDCTGTTCLTCPTLGTDPVAVTLGNKDVPTSTDFNPSGSSTYGNEAHIFTPTNKYHIHTVVDNWGQDISTPSPNWKPNDDSFDSDPFYINYSQFIADYPYDSHTITVYYKAQFTDQKYTATGTYHKNAGTYDWVPVGGLQTKDTQQYWGWYSTTNSQSLSECYNRAFQVQPPSASAATHGASDEPTSASFGFNVPVNFYLPNPPSGVGSTGLHSPMKVCGLNYTANYYIKNDATGATSPLPGHSSDSGGVPSPDGCLHSSGGTNSTGSATANWTTPTYTFGSGVMQPGDEVCVNFSVTPEGDLMDENGNIQPAGGNGTSATASDCSAPMVNEPYFKVFNSGISAGGDFACSSAGGVLAGFNDDSGSDRGSGAQLSALALVGITGVASAQNAAAGAPTGLTFANTGVNPVTSSYDSPSLGGSFGGTGCLTGESAPQTATADLGPSATVGSGLLVDGAHTYASSNFTLYGGNVATSKNPAVFVTGHNVYISSNGNGGIKYTGGTAASPWTVTNTSTTVPSFVLMVTGGNIYIDPSVTELDGTYIAASSAGIGGKIYTCANGFNPMPANAMFSNCGNPLTVYGSFVADQVDLGRTRGSLRESSPGETAASNNAAEIFNFSPEMYTSNQSVTPPGGGAVQYKAWTNLPPVL